MTRPTLRIDLNLIDLLFGNVQIIMAGIFPDSTDDNPSPSPSPLPVPDPAPMPVIDPSPSPAPAPEPAPATQSVDALLTRYGDAHAALGAAQDALALAQTAFDGTCQQLKDALAVTGPVYTGDAAGGTIEVWEADASAGGIRWFVPKSASVATVPAGGA